MDLEEAKVYVNAQHSKKELLVKQPFVLEMRLSAETVGTILGLLEKARQVAVKSQNQEVLELIERGFEEFTDDLEKSFVASLARESDHVQEAVQLFLPFESEDLGSLGSGDGSIPERTRPSAEDIEAVRQEDPLD